MSIESNARDYAHMHRPLKYDDIVAHAAKNYTTDAERKAFVDAVLDADIRISNDEARRTESAPFPSKTN